MTKRINVAVDHIRNVLLDEIVERRKDKGSLIKSKTAIIAEAIEAIHKKEIKRDIK